MIWLWNKLLVLLGIRQPLRRLWGHDNSCLGILETFIFASRQLSLIDWHLRQMHQTPEISQARSIITEAIAAGQEVDSMLGLCQRCYLILREVAINTRHPIASLDQRLLEVMSKKQIQEMREALARGPR